MTIRGNEEIGLSLRQSLSDMADERGDAGYSLVTTGSEPKRDWSAALDLVREASEAIRIRDERTTEMEIEHRLDAERAAEEIRSLQEQLDETEVRLAESEARARRAEARASEAEAWLAKMHDAIIGSFSKVVGTESDDAQVEADLRAAFLNNPQGDEQ
ncbi:MULTISPECIES: hypothetical protein [unclassified Aureimonas]|uniref:hypothetical protein n=1 Tax=unclassified Aureimonas TaxID=2615206 RepID=UPI000722FBE2|nr:MULTISPECIES: hypothetical protein [unclassified Aureimonas]ALN73904.1 hypothetical protein M673_14350 [Aureimonas sp. AU20]